MKELPDSEKPYEKCMAQGPQSLSDAELLAVFIRTGTKGMTSVELAQDFLSRGNKNLLNLYDYSLQELMKLPGVGKAKAVQLVCIAEYPGGLPRQSVSGRYAFMTRHPWQNFTWKSSAMKSRSILSAACLEAGDAIWVTAS